MSREGRGGGLTEWFKIFLGYFGAFVLISGFVREALSTAMLLSCGIGTSRSSEGERRNDLLRNGNRINWAGILKFQDLKNRLFQRIGAL